MAQATKAAPAKTGGKSNKKNAASGSLVGELASGRLYKPNSGRIVRQVTAVAVALLLVMVAVRMYQLLDADRGATTLTFALPVAVVVAGLWFAFRLVNWPRFANFLIDVETEMQKVSWASWDYLKRATIVVLAVMFIIGFVLFGFDLIWQALFKLVHFIDPNAMAIDDAAS